MATVLSSTVLCFIAKGLDHKLLVWFLLKPFLFHLTLQKYFQGFVQCLYSYLCGGCKVSFREYAMFSNMSNRCNISICLTGKTLNFKSFI